MKDIDVYFNMGGRSLTHRFYQNLQAAYDWVSGIERDYGFQGGGTPENGSLGCANPNRYRIRYNAYDVTKDELADIIQEVKLQAEQPQESQDATTSSEAAAD